MKKTSDYNTMKRRNGETEKRRTIIPASPLPRFPASFTFILLFTAFTGCIAITSEEDPIQKDINSLRQDMAVQQQKLASLEEAVKKETAGREQEGRSQKSEVGRIDEYVQKGKADVNASLDKIKEDMAFLSGRFEEAEAEVKKIKNHMGLLQTKTADSKETKEMSSKLVSVQDRFAVLEKRVAVMDERFAAMEQAVEKLNQGQAKMSFEAEEAKKYADKKEAKPPKPDELYNEAIKLIKDKDYSNAVEKFTGFISIFPDHELASNAQYWIGEIYYAQKDYERAVLEFNDVVQKYPKSKKVPAALLKQGMAFSELGNKKEARLVLEKVMDKYPKTEEAGRAQKTLKGMK